MASANLSTIIQGPQGITEAKSMSSSVPNISSGLLSKRNELKEMLVSKLVKQHGAEPMRKAVIVREVERSSVLKAGNLTTQGLASLERAVAEAVRATQPGPMVSHNAGRDDPRKVWTGGEMAAAVKAVSNWTDVAMHRASYAAVEDTALNAAKERKKIELRQTLAHQLADTKYKHAAERKLVAEEARQVAADLAAHHAEQAKAAEAAKARMLAQKRDRATQLHEQAARAAAAERLRKLEDDEVTEHLKREQEAAKLKQEAKQRANEEYHRSTAKANAASREKREAAKQAEWDEEMRLNAQWKAMLDKQEAERKGQYERLRERIHKMQRVYEDNAGAEEEAKLKAEEQLREYYIQLEKERAEKEYADKRTARKEAISATTKYLFEQMAEQDSVRKSDKAAEERYAASVKADAIAAADKEEEKKLLAKARAKTQQSYLNEQITQQKQQAARDPGASEMTALEATLNRSLLVSIVQHKARNC